MRALPEIDYDDHPAYQGLAVGAAELRDEALSRLWPALEAKRRRLARSADVIASRAPGAADPVAETLARDGAAGIKLDDSLLGPLKSAAKPLLEGLDRLHAERNVRGMPLGFKHIQTELCVGGEWKPEAEACAAPIRTLLDRSGVYELAQSYYPGFSARLWDVCLRQNVENQPFFALEPAGATPETMGMHIDSSGSPVFNGVIYLSEVGPDNGPFRYAKGSNHWDWELEDRAIRKAVDELGFAPASDARFLALPHGFRRRANFGCDLLDGEPTSQALLAQEAMFCSSDCDMALFDSEGVHRGGDVRQGHRSSILFLLTLEPRGTA